MFVKIKEKGIYKRTVIIGIVILLITGVFVISYENTYADTIKGTTKNQQRAAIYYTYTQDADTCETKLTVRLRVYATGSDYGTNKADAPWSLTYNGTTKTGTKDYKIPSSGDYVNISSSYSKTISQPKGAAKDISLSGWINLSGTSVGGKLSVSDTITLPAFRPSTTYSSKTVSGTIVWNDDNNRDGVRPDSVTVTLYRNGSSQKTATAETEFKWTGLYTYASGGSAYTYNVKGSEVPGYTMSVSETTITYTHNTATTNFAGTIVWDDENNMYELRPDSVDVTIIRNGNEELTKTAVNNEFSFTKWWIYYDGGKKYDYTFKGSDVPGYTMSVSGTTITYTYTPVGSLGVIFGFSI